MRASIARLIFARNWDEYSFEVFPISMEEREVASPAGPSKPAAMGHPLGLIESDSVEEAGPRSDEPRMLTLDDELHKAVS